MSELHLYPMPEPPDIGLIGYIHESEYEEIQAYGGYGWTTLPFDEAMWTALVGAGVIAALPEYGEGSLEQRPVERPFNPEDVVPVLDRLLPTLSGELRSFVQSFRDLAAEAGKHGAALDIWVT